MVTPFKSFKLIKCVNRCSIGVFGYFSFGVLLNGALTSTHSLSGIYIYKYIFFSKRNLSKVSFHSRSKVLFLSNWIE